MRCSTTSPLLSSHTTKYLNLIQLFGLIALYLICKGRKANFFPAFLGLENIIEMTTNRPGTIENETIVLHSIPCTLE